MTAEIAILNRTAVALAADSIVTFAGPRKKSKTYDSAEKIFQLSRYQPIGLMIYNNALFMNAPLEVLIRSYREKLGATMTTGFQKLIQAWPSFEAFLLNFKRSRDDELEHFQNMLIAELKHFVDALLKKKIDGAFEKKRKSSESADGLLLRRIAERKTRAESEPLDPPFLPDISLEKFVEYFGPAIEEIAKDLFSAYEIKLGPDLYAQLGEMMLAVLRSATRSKAYTGLVFAGFGSEDLFPTLYAIEIDGIYFDRMRSMNIQLFDIDRSGPTAAIVPFAQKDMPERFIFGIDKELEDGLASIAKAMVSDVVSQAGDAFNEEQAELTIEAATRQFRTGIDSLKMDSEEGLKAVVNHMSKKELGEIAFSLVELTSRKRRYSTDLETVGGPIDVAILTRNEGFIWVRRKHYFDADINPQYVPR